MERLTETCKFDNQEYVMLKNHRTWILRKEYDGNTDSENAIVRLAAYEDTGLTPEEVEQLKGECFGWKCDAEKYKTAKEDERLIVLPCKVWNDRVYQIYNAYDNYDGCDCCLAEYGLETPCAYYSSGHCKSIPLQDKFGRKIRIASRRFRYEMIPKIGKTVFLTREEAEAALAAMEGREDE